MWTNKRYFKLLILLGMLLLTVGCTNTGNSGSELEESEQNIRIVLNKLLNGPDKKQKKIIEGYGDDIEKLAKKHSDYNGEFKPYMSEFF